MSPLRGIYQIDKSELPCALKAAPHFFMRILDSVFLGGRWDYRSPPLTQLERSHSTQAHFTPVLVSVTQNSVHTHFLMRIRMGHWAQKTHRAQVQPHIVAQDDTRTKTQTLTAPRGARQWAEMPGTPCPC